MSAESPKTIEPNEEALRDPDVVTIELAGKRWPIPRLAIRQNRIIVPLLLDLTALTPEKITQKQFDDVTTVVYTALTRAHPKLTLAEFCEWPVTTAELMLALMAIGDQTGIIRRKTPQEGGDSTEGESKAGEDSQTGTE